MACCDDREDINTFALTGVNFRSLFPIPDRVLTPSPQSHDVSP